MNPLINHANKQRIQSCLADLKLFCDIFQNDTSVQNEIEEIYNLIKLVPNSKANKLAIQRYLGRVQCKIKAVKHLFDHRQFHKQTRHQIQDLLTRCEYSVFEIASSLNYDADRTKRDKLPTEHHKQTAVSASPAKAMNLKSSSSSCLACGHNRKQAPIINLWIFRENSEVANGILSMPYSENEKVENLTAGVLSCVARTFQLNRFWIQRVHHHQIMKYDEKNLAMLLHTIRDWDSLLITPKHADHE